MDDFNSSLFSPFFSASSRTDVADSPKTRNLLPGKKRTKDLSAVAEQKSPTRVSQFDYLPGLIDSVNGVADDEASLRLISLPSLELPANGVAGDEASLRLCFLLLLELLMESPAV
nr:hypothetical protein Itr_chr07CG07320 [Ipomoea trifida]